MSDLRLNLDGDLVSAYLATPEGGGVHPGVVVLPDLFGLNGDHRHITDRLAAAGYTALCVNFYSLRCVRSAFKQLAAGSGRITEQVTAARRWLADRGDCSGKVGVIGFCLGGGFALLAAPSGEFDVAAVNYGPLTPHAEEMLGGSCPIVASYGAKDKQLAKHVVRLEAKLEEAGIEADIKTYPTAGHSFLNHFPPPLSWLGKVTGMGYEPGSAADAWSRIETFFGRHLT